MECTACGPSKDHDILFNCKTCGKSFCNDHINNHPHAATSQQSQQYTPMGRFAIDLSQLQQMAQQAAIQREPTKQDYERFLRMNPQVLTTGREYFDLLLGIGLIAWVFGFQPLLQGVRPWQYIVVLTIIISPAFILHELAHKFMAIRYGKFARFTLVRTMAYFTFLAGLVGIPIAGPGATMILGRTSQRESGIFAAAGPATNFLIALVSMIVGYLIPTGIAVPGVPDYFLNELFFLSAFINGILGVFNLIPFGAFDGKKIINWNALVWVVLVAINIPMVIVSFPFI